VWSWRRRVVGKDEGEKKRRWRKTEGVMDFKEIQCAWEEVMPS